MKRTWAFISLGLASACFAGALVIFSLDRPMSFAEEMAVICFNVAIPMCVALGYACNVEIGMKSLDVESSAAAWLMWAGWLCALAGLTALFYSFGSFYGGCFVASLVWSFILVGQALRHAP